MSEVAFTITGRPAGKGRPRASVIAGHAHLRTDDKTREREGLVAKLAHDAMAGRAPFDGPVMVEVVAVVAPAKSWPKKRITAALSGSAIPTGRPDLDNIVKLVWDGCNGVVFHDDSQVVSLVAERRFGAVAETRVRVAPL